MSKLLRTCLVSKAFGSEHLFVDGQCLLIERDREISPAMGFVEASHRMKRIRYRRMIVAKTFSRISFERSKRGIANDTLSEYRLSAR